MFRLIYKKLRGKCARFCWRRFTTKRPTVLLVSSAAHEAVDTRPLFSALEGWQKPCLGTLPMRSLRALMRPRVQGAWSSWRRRRRRTGRRRREASNCQSGLQSLALIGANFCYSGNRFKCSFQAGSRAGEKKKESGAEGCSWGKWEKDAWGEEVIGLKFQPWLLQVKNARKRQVEEEREEEAKMRRKERLAAVWKWPEMKHFFSTKVFN